MISFLWYENSQKVTKKSQNLFKVLPKTVLFRSIALIFSFEKPCYLENRVVREPCKRRSACITISRHWKSNFKQTLIFCLLSVVICRRKIFLAQESKLFRQWWCLFGDHDYWETKTFSMCMNDLLPRKADDRHYLLPNFTIMG